MANVTLTRAQARFVEAARRVTLATRSPSGRPRPMPVCFAMVADEYGEPRLYTPIDEKPKRSGEAARLARIRDIEARPEVAVLVDRWDEDWSRLAWLRLEGTASVLWPERGSDRPADGGTGPEAGSSRPTKGGTKVEEGSGRPTDGAAGPMDGPSRPDDAALPKPGPIPTIATDAGADADERRIAIGLLRARYAQYADHDLERRPLICISVTRVVAWGAIDGA
jgi:PPOX class probable F420-dependent enzyme